MPATAAPLTPPLSPPAVVAEASDGLALGEVTPLHRSAETLRAEAGAGAVSVLLAEERAVLLERSVDLTVARVGAVELANTV